MRHGRFEVAAGALIVATWLVSGCNDRFVFDVESSGGGAGDNHGGAAGATAGAAGTAGSAGVSSCGTGPACPGGLHCIAEHCYPCATDADCSAPAPRCDAQQHRCVACSGSSDCAIGFTCDPVANHCLPTCQDEVDCPANAHGCDEHRTVCYQCDEDRECASSTLGHLCAVDGSGCVQCHDDADCPGQHCEQLAGRCVECRDWRDCASALCDVNGSCLVH